MRHNGRPVLVASELTPNLLMLYPGQRPVLACPGLRDVARAAARHTARAPGRGQRAALPRQWPAGPDRPDCRPVARGPSGGCP